MTPTNSLFKAVWKYPIEPGLVNKITMPVDAVILTVDIQNQVPHIWVEVSPDAPLAERTFHTIATGAPFSAGLKYLGTFQILGGEFIFHIYEESK